MVRSKHFTGEWRHRPSPEDRDPRRKIVRSRPGDCPDRRRRARRSECFSNPSDARVRRLRQGTARCRNPQNWPPCRCRRRLSRHGAQGGEVDGSKCQVENFDDLENLLGTLPAKSKMTKHQPPITTDAQSGRVDEEKRHARVRAFLYAASHPVTEKVFEPETHA